MVKRTTTKTKRTFDSDGKVVKETTSTVWEEDTNQYGFPCYTCPTPDVTSTSTEVPEILIKYHDDTLEKIEQITVGDWIDLRASEKVALWGGETAIVPLGISMQLPEGYEAIIAPRSSTCKRLGIIQTNSVGVIDNSYCGNDDVWGMPVYALHDTVIHKNDRICQFRILKSMGPVKLTEVDNLSNENRGGFGSTNDPSEYESITITYPEGLNPEDLYVSDGTVTVSGCEPSDNESVKTDDSSEGDQ